MIKKLPISNRTAIIMDRTKAIKEAMKIAQPGDWILLTGKGHERYVHTFQAATTSEISDKNRDFLEMR